MISKEKLTKKLSIWGFVSWPLKKKGRKSLHLGLPPASQAGAKKGLLQSIAWARTNVSSQGRPVRPPSTGGRRPPGPDPLLPVRPPQGPLPAGRGRAQGGGNGQEEGQEDLDQVENRFFANFQKEHLFYFFSYFSRKPGAEIRVVSKVPGPKARKPCYNKEAVTKFFFCKKARYFHKRSTSYFPPSLNP